MASIIQIRRDTAANWTATDPILAVGEIGYETNTGKLKIGDGLTIWSLIIYYSSAPLSTNQIDAITGSNTPSSLNVFATMLDIAGLVTTYAGLSDVNLTSLSNGETVKYDSGTGMWINTSFPSGISGLTATYIPVATSSSTIGDSTLTVAAIVVVSGSTMTGDILFTAGKGIDTTATGGTDILNIGATNADVVNIGRSGGTVNILGAVLNEYETNAYVTDKLITLNSGGAVASASATGFEIEENAIITGYIKTSATRNGFEILTPAIAYKATLLFTSLTADKIFTFPNNSGTFALLTDIPTLGSLGGQPLSTNLTSLSGLTYASSSFVKMTGANTFTLDTSAYITLTALSSSATGLTYTNGTGVFSLTALYVIPTTTEESNWNTAYANVITTFTTIGSSGAATLGSNTLNIPNYTLAGLSGQPLATNLTSLSGLAYASASFVKMTAAGTFGLDTNVYLTGTDFSGLFLLMGA